MKYLLIAVGRLKSGPESALLDTYKARLKTPLIQIELEAKPGLLKDKRIEDEGTKILEAVPTDAFVIVLDERGKDFTSVDFSHLIQQQTVKGYSCFVFVIGGADGLSNGVIRRADVLLSFGKMTWPHMLVRGLVAEQLFRAECIATGHPYHRA